MSFLKLFSALMILILPAISAQAGQQEEERGAYQLTPVAPGPLSVQTRSGAAYSASAQAGQQEEEQGLVQLTPVGPGRVIEQTRSGAASLVTRDAEGFLISVQNASVMPFLSPAFEAWEGVVAETHPRYFTGYGLIDQGVVNSFRQARAFQPQTGSFFRSIFLIDDPRSEREGRRVLRQFAPTVQIPENATIGEIYYAILIHAFSLGTPSELEDNVFGHLPGNKEYEFLKLLGQQKRYWPLRETGMDLAQSLASFEHQMRGKKTEKFSTSYVSSANWRLVEEGARTGLVGVPYPVNAGQLGLAFLCRQFMKDVYPIGVCEEDVPVHGTTLKPGPMARHDEFHAYISSQGRRFKEWVATVLGNVVDQEVSGRDFLDQATPQLRAQYESVMGIYDYLYQQSTAMLMQGDEGAYKKMLVAFFLALHEYPILNLSAYDHHDPLEILGQHLKAVRKFLKAELSYDKVLQTNALTGESPLDDKAVVKALLPKIIEEAKIKIGFAQFEEYNYEKKVMEYSEGKAKQWLQNNIRDLKIERSPYSIDLSIELNSGKVLHISSASTRKRFILGDDLRKILGFAGVRLKRPVLSDDEGRNKELITRHYDQVKTGLFGVLDFFEAQAKGILDPGILAPFNFSEAYSAASRENHQEMRDIVAELKAKKATAETLWSDL